MCARLIIRIDVLLPGVTMPVVPLHPRRAERKRDDVRHGDSSRWHARLAGAAGFEPANAGSKVRVWLHVTKDLRPFRRWRRPSVASLLQCYTKISMRRSPKLRPPRPHSRTARSRTPARSSGLAQARRVADLPLQKRARQANERTGSTSYGPTSRRSSPRSISATSCAGPAGQRRWCWSAARRMQSTGTASPAPLRAVRDDALVLGSARSPSTAWAAIVPRCKHAKSELRPMVRAFAAWCGCRPCSVQLITRHARRTCSHR